MDESNKKKIPMVVVAGPTATGKSTLAMGIAKEFSGEIVSADSMQVYRTLDIGTAKIKRQDRGGISHHMIDIVDPDVRYSLADYLDDVRKVIDEIAGRGNLPVICGGTGLYISSLVRGIHLPEEETDASLREELALSFDRLGGEMLIEEIARSDKAYAKKLHANDKKRIVRALELIRGLRITPSEANKRSRETPSPYDAFDVILNPKERETLYDRVNLRVDSMMKEGLLDEAVYVYKNRDRFTVAGQAIGYKEFFPFFEGNVLEQDAVLDLKQVTRRYAKRQIAWFKKYAGGSFFDLSPPDTSEIFSSIKKHLKV